MQVLINKNDASLDLLNRHFFYKISRLVDKDHSDNLTCHNKEYFMKKVTVIIWLFCFMGIFILSSCGISKDKMARGIKESFQEKMDTDTNYKKYQMKVQKVSLIKTGSNSYDGYVNILLADESHDVSISVTTKGDSYEWEIKPLAFAFLVQYELKNFDW